MLTSATIDPIAIRADFPILQQRIHRDRPLIYLDNGASTQRPTQVIDAMGSFYREHYSNVHRGLHWLSERSSEKYEQARLAVQRWIRAPFANEVIFTSGTTLAINTVAHAWGNSNVQEGDSILLPIFEHHSNIVPWQQLATRKKANVKFVDIDAEGKLDLVDLERKLDSKTRMIAFAATSNVLGTLTPVQEVVNRAKSVGAATLIDAAQHVPHAPTNVQDWGADFVTFSGHKMLGPSGVGVLWGRQELLESMPPFLGGGSMIDKVTSEGFTPGELPARFEAGTPPIAEAIGLHAALDYLGQFDLNAIQAHEHQLVCHAIELLRDIEGIKILGPVDEPRAGLVSFSIEGVSAQDISILLDQHGIAIRAGHHCAMPLHDYLNIKSTCRASFYLYNTMEEVEQFADVLRNVVNRLR